MKAISIAQPWAAAVVFGEVELINLPFSTRYRGRLLIHAGAPDRRVHSVPAIHALAGRLPYGRRRNVYLGIVELTDIQRPGPDGCQLPWAEGPYCWLVREPLVLPEPDPGAGRGGGVKPWRGFADPPPDLRTPGLAGGLTPRQWHARRQAQAQRNATNDQVFGPQRPGEPRYTGD